MIAVFKSPRQVCHLYFAQLIPGFWCAKSSDSSSNEPRAASLTCLMAMASRHYGFKLIDQFDDPKSFRDRIKKAMRDNPRIDYPE